MRVAAAWGRYGWRAGVVIGLFVLTRIVANSLETLRRQTEDLLRSSYWMAAQSEIELLRFLRALDDHQRGAPEAGANALALRFEILWSRMSLILEGEEGAFVREVPGAVQLEIGRASCRERVCRYV